MATLEPDNRARKYAEEIRKAGLQATGLIRQLLAIVKPSRSEPRLLSLNEIAEGMRNLLVRLIGENIELTFHLDSNLGLIKMDRTQAQQILLNLVLNARGAMPGGGRISITTSDCRVQVLPDTEFKPSRNTLIESELFGYVKGAFTGANQSKDGVMAMAEGGTIFLDEVGELRVDLQAKMLRAIQEKEIRPVGGTRRVPLNVRILVATNRDLEQGVM